MNRCFSLLLALPLLAMLSGCGTLMAELESDSIDEDPGVRSLAAQVLDETIETKAIINIRAADDGFDKSRFNVVSYNGYVLITGEVGTPELKTKANDVLRQIEGVRRIYNELETAPVSGTEEQANDVWITSKVKTALLVGSNTPALRVKVLTENGVVYLMGLLTPEEAKRVAEKASGIIGVKRVVQLFELI